MKAKKIRDLLIIVAGLAVAAYLFKSLLLVEIDMLLLLCALLSDRLFDMILYGWKKSGDALGYINTRIILFALFFVIITPYSFVMKLFGRKADRQKNSTGFIVMNRIYSKNDFENMW